MTSQQPSFYLEPSEQADPLFLTAEQLAQNFSLFPEHSQTTLATSLKGLLSEDSILANQERLTQLSVDDYVAQVILPTQDKKRIGAKKIISRLSGRLITERQEGPFYTAEIELDFGDRYRRVGFICQERSINNGAWLPEHHQVATEYLCKYAEMSLPIIFLIDTPGAEANEAANNHNQAHSISRMVAESSNLDVPTVGIVVGMGYSGGAIPLAAANILLSVRDGIFNTIQPQGLQSIARKFNLSWQECAKSAGVAPEELLAAGCIDGIIDYSPLDTQATAHHLRQAIVSSVQAIEQAAIHYVREFSDLEEHFLRGLNQYLSESNDNKKVAQQYLKRANSPTVQHNLFGICYRYMRYLTLRSRIHSISQEQYGRLSKLTIPEGDLQDRIRTEQGNIFSQWLNNPDKVRYDEELTKDCTQFLNKKNGITKERNPVTRLILGQPRENFERAKEQLIFNLTFVLYNRWKSNASNNFRALIHHLEELPKDQNNTGWPDIDVLTVLNIVEHPELRDEFIISFHNILIFNALYNNVVSNLALIAQEAMETKSMSRDSVSELYHRSLEQAFSKLGGQNSSRSESSFKSWLHYFTTQSNRAELLAKVEQWKSVGFPQLNESLFVVITYFFERLLPEFFNSENLVSKYRGQITPVRIGRRKDFWNRLTMGYRDLLIQNLLRKEKRSGKMKYEQILERFIDDFTELNNDKITANLMNFPGFRLSIEDAIDKGVRPCGLITGLGHFKLKDEGSVACGVAVSNTAFQAGAFDMASAEKFSALLNECAQKRLPIICFISSGGMQTKEGAAALFSMAIVNDRLTGFTRDHGLPVLIFGFGDCTGGAQASFVTHPLVHTYYFSGTNMPFAGQMVVPSYLPSTSTLSNYLSQVPGAMTALVTNPFSETLDTDLRSIDPTIPTPNLSIEHVIKDVLSGQLEQSKIPTRRVEKNHDPRSLMQPIQKVLIHARGCTAVKLIRRAHDNDIRVVLVASDPDMNAIPADMLKEGDHIECLGGNTSDESYLNAYSVLKIAEYEGVNALHPGIGFLSESPKFAELCVSNGINFIGPSEHSMASMGNKSNAIKMAQSQNVPVVPGSHGILQNVNQSISIANQIGYPVLLKAVQGGGGKGIQRIEKADDLLDSFQRISTEAQAAFGNGDLYLEKCVTSLRHIEVQVLRDQFGHTKVLGLRDCSVQRNNQKVIEESNSTLLSAELKESVMEYTKRLADAVDYFGAGTVEYIFNLDANEVYFMEMNTRLQVEHPVTEATSGIDIVSAQYHIASGGSIEELQPLEQGYAVEVRVTAEKAVLDRQGTLQLQPNPGLISECIMPERDDIEIISIAGTGKEISPYYDSLIAQIICYGEDREDVVEKLIGYLKSVSIKGIATNIPLLIRILQDEVFRGGDYDTTYLPKFMARLDKQSLITEMETAIGSQSLSTDTVRIANSEELKVLAQNTGIFYTAPAPGEDDFVKEGDIVSTETTLGLLEAMKMFTKITLDGYNSVDEVLYSSDRQYRVERIMNSNGQQVSQGDLLFVIKPMPKVK